MRMGRAHLKVEHRGNEKYLLFWSKENGRAWVRSYSAQTRRSSSQGTVLADTCEEMRGVEKFHLCSHPGLQSPCCQAVGLTFCAVSDDELLTVGIAMRSPHARICWRIENLPESELKCQFELCNSCRSNRGGRKGSGSFRAVRTELLANWEVGSDFGFKESEECNSVYKQINRNNLQSCIYLPLVPCQRIASWMLSLKL